MEGLPIFDVSQGVVVDCDGNLYPGASESYSPDAENAGLAAVQAVWRHLSRDERLTLLEVCEHLLSGAEFSRENQTNGYIL